jgi:hypothetical protein
MIMSSVKDTRGMIKKGLKYENIETTAETDTGMGEPFNSLPAVFRRIFR